MQFCFLVNYRQIIQMIEIPSIFINRITTVTPGVIEAARRLASLLGSGNQANISADYLSKITDSPNTHWLGATLLNDSRIIGMATLTIMPMMTNIRAGLESVVVDESVRGFGIATELCKEARVIADSLGVNTLRAAAMKDNVPSLGMLEKLGFEIETSMHYLELDIQQGPRF